jgi:hypothetical protein
MKALTQLLAASVFVCSLGILGRFTDLSRRQIFVIASLLTGGAMLTRRILRQKLRGEPVGLVPDYWVATFDLLKVVFSRFLSALPASGEQMPNSVNLYLLSILHSKHNEVLVSPPVSPGRTDEYVTALGSYSRFALASYGFLYANQGRPMALEEIIHNVCTVGNDDIIYYNHTPLSSLATASRKRPRAKSSSSIYVDPTSELVTTDVADETVKEASIFSRFYDDDDEEEDVVLLPRYFVVYEHIRKSIVVAVRGTMSIADIVTDLLCDNVPLLGGWAHQGSVMATKHFLRDVAGSVTTALEKHADYSLVFVGHSLGGAVALLATIMLLSDMPSLPFALTDEQRRKLRCYAFGPPPVFSPISDLDEYREQIFVAVNDTDFIPRLSFTSLTRLLRQANIIERLPLTWRERVEICARGDAERLVALLPPDAIYFMPNADVNGAVIGSAAPPTISASSHAKPAATLQSALQRAPVELALPGTVLWCGKGLESRWRVVDAASLANVRLTPTMISDHLPSRYSDRFGDE